MRSFVLVRLIIALFFKRSLFFHQARPRINITTVTSLLLIKILIKETKVMLNWSLKNYQYLFKLFVAEQIYLGLVYANYSRYRIV